MSQVKKSVIAALFTTAALLSACGGSSSSKTAILSLDLVDAPVDGALGVVVRVKGVSMRNPAGEDIAFRYCADRLPTEGNVDIVESTMVLAGAVECKTPHTREIELLALTGGEALRLLNKVTVPAGYYPWIRLDLDDDNPGFIELADGIHDLKIPSGANTGLKLVGGFTATINGNNHLLMDFDLRKSVHRAGVKYLLRPTIRLVNLKNATKQRLSGEWLTEDIGECGTPMAYVYEGNDIRPDDIGGTGTQPLTTAKFIADKDGTKSIYQIDYIAYGDYTVAYVCEGIDDDPELDNDMEFATVTNAAVVE